MNLIKGKIFSEERALFSAKNIEVVDCTFKDGESPLKESNTVSLSDSTFMWKYPLWYSENITCNNVTLKETARSGIWYTKNITMNNCEIIAPKTFRRSEKITLNGCNLSNALETMWGCKHIKINKGYIKGDYFGMNSEDIFIDGIKIDGNYAFDGGKNITVNNSTLNSKDVFWNCENVKATNCTINGEYLGWNSKNVTFINCTIISHQGFCYMENVRLINCKIINSDLIFEYCKDIYAEIKSHIDSVKNPISGYIHAESIGTLILDKHFIDPTRTKIVVNKH